MKSRGIIGQRIVEVRHYRIAAGEARRAFMGVDWLRLENGVILETHARETATCPVGTIVAHRPKRKACK